MKEVNYKEWQENPTPREMWVWKDNPNDIIKRKVIYILEDAMYPVVVLDESEQFTRLFRHCAEIEETKPKYRRYTNQELAWRLQDGIKEGKHREWKLELEIDTTIRSIMTYSENQANDFVKNVLVRENGGEWREPLVETEEYKDYLESEKAYNDGV